MRRSAVAASLAALFSLSAAAAQAPRSTEPPSTPSPPAPARPVPGAQLTCADFRHNRDGSWTPIVPIQVGGVALSAYGVSFTAGVSMGGVDLGAILNAHCLKD